MDFAVKAVLFSWLLGVGLSTASAAEVRVQQDRVEVVVADTSDGARAAATQTAIGVMLMQLSGLQGMLGSPMASAIAADAERYVLDFSYITAEADALRLALRLDVPALRRLLVERGIRIWPERRPLVLVWLVEQVGNRRDFVTAPQSPEWLDQLREQAAALGLRLVFPLLDLEDLQAVNFTDIAAGFHGPVRVGSARYDADRILTGVIEHDPNSSSSSIRWTLLDEVMVIRRWQDEGESTVSTLSRLMRDDFAYRPHLQSREQMEVVVSNVGSFVAHQRVLQRLEEVEGVSQVKPTEVIGERASFLLILSGGAERVRDSIARDPQLMAEGDGYRLR